MGAQTLATVQPPHAVWAEPRKRTMLAGFMSRTETGTMRDDLNHTLKIESGTKSSTHRWFRGMQLHHPHPHKPLMGLHESMC